MSSGPACPLAIIGIGCLFPKAPDARTYWLNVKHGVDAIGPVPPTHWNPVDYLDPDPKAPDRTYAARGGFLDPVEFRPLDFGIAPNDLEAIDTSQLLGLVAAREALLDAGYGPDREFDRNRVSVIVGVTGTLELVIPLGARLGHPRWRKALKDAGIPDAKADEIIRDIGDSYVGWQENSFPGLLGNVVAGRIANRLDLGGTNCVVDAACASSLSAIHLAGLELAAGRSDMVITGGVDAFNDIFMYMCFSKTPALSPTGDAKPFDANGDGTILGEGLGIVVLKRLDDARRDGDRIYAVIKGLGTSSDGKGQAIYAPSADGQTKALRNAYEQAGVAPDTIELVEAHGTGTRVGDAVEVEALTQVYREARSEGAWCALGSVKSQIGHTKAAAGAAGLIKAALALHHKVLPPTIKVRSPIGGISNSPLYVNAQPRPWIANPNYPRRAAVSAFGFGGSNFHCVLEEADPAKTNVDWNDQVEIVALSARGVDALLPKLEEWSTLKSWPEIQRAAMASREQFNLLDPVRLLLVPQRDATDLPGLISAVRAKLKTESSTASWKLSEGAYFGQGPAAGTLAVLFPGQGSQYPNMLRDLACTFPAMLDVIANANRAFDASTRLSDQIYPPSSFTDEERELQKWALRPTNVAQPAIGAVSLGAWRTLESFGLKADAFAGHSYGELAALCAAGCLDESAFHALSCERGRLMASFSGDAGGMLAVHAPLAIVDDFVKAENLDLVVANRNAPNQVVLSGRTPEIERAARLITQRNVQTTRLPVAAAFHSPLVAEAREPFRKSLASTAVHTAKWPVYSNTSTATYPGDAEAIRQMLAGQLAAPVNFVDQIRQMARDGVRNFLEVGPGSTLTRLTSAILAEERDVECWSVHALDASTGRKPGMLDLAHALAWLASRGHAVNLQLWQQDGRTASAEQPARKGLIVPICGANYVAPKKTPTRTPAAATPPAAPPKPMPAQATPRTQPKPTVPTPKAMIDPHAHQNGHYHPTLEKPAPAPSAESLAQALQVTQQSLSAFQKLQEQTAQLHKQFLENQEAAQRTLQMLVEQQHSLLQGGAQATRIAVRQPERLERNGHDRTAVPARELPSRLSEPKREANGVYHQNGHAPAAPASRIASLTEPATLTKPSLSTASAQVETILFGVIAEKTGYPPEMLSPEMALDSDLGIDSIKRVEIFSALQEKLPNAPVVKPEHLGSLHTLADVIAFLEPATQARDVPIEPMAQAREVASTLACAAGPNDCTSILFEVISEKTGYPTEMLAPEMALDADLGIDSIKRVEIFSALQERLPDAPVVKPEHLGSLHALADVIAFLAERPLETAPVQKKTAESRPSAKPNALIERSVLYARPTSLRKLSASRLTGVVCLVGDDSLLCAALRRAIKDSGFRVEFRRWFDPSALDADAIAGLILLAPQTNDVPDLALRAFHWMKAMRLALLVTARKDLACFATITRLGGSFGIDTLPALEMAETGALAGLAKTAGHEWPSVRCRAIDIADDLPPERAGEIWNAILEHGANEIGFPKTGAIELALQPQTAASGQPLVNRSDVVLISGGARGVTAAAAQAIAESAQPTIVLLGRSGIDRPEPDYTHDCATEAAIKKALARNLPQATPKSIESEYRRISARREILATLEALHAVGARAHYFTADVTDAAAIERVLQTVRSEVGPITCLIHGAGVLADRRIEDLSDEAFAIVYATKVHGLNNLLQALKNDPLRAIVLFSSSTGRFGRTGQAAYAAANEALNKIARQRARQMPYCKVVSINWGPWDGGMVTPALRKLFAEEGVGVIPLRDGGAFLVNELSMPQSDVEVTVIAKPEAVPPNSESSLIQVFERTVSVADHPILESHVIGGRAVLPLALHMEWLAHAALHGNPGLAFHGFNDLRVLHGVQLKDSETIRLRVLAGRARKDGSLFVVPVELHGERPGRHIVHSRAEVVLSSRLPSAPSPRKPPSLADVDLEPSAAYERLLFHGLDMQGIESITSLGREGIVVDCRTAPPPAEWFRFPLRNAWIADPLVIDAAFQAMIVWSAENEGVGCLPSFVGSYRQYRRAFPQGIVQIVATITRRSGAMARADIEFLDEQGGLIARIENHESVIDDSLNLTFQRNRLGSESTLTEGVVR